MKWDDKAEKYGYFICLAICWAGDILIWIRWIEGKIPYIGNALVATLLCCCVTAFLIYNEYKNKKGE